MEYVFSITVDSVNKCCLPKTLFDRDSTVLSGLSKDLSSKFKCTREKA